ADSSPTAATGSRGTLSRWARRRGSPARSRRGKRCCLTRCPSPPSVPWPPGKTQTAALPQPHGRPAAERRDSLNLLDGVFDRLADFLNNLSHFLRSAFDGLHGGASGFLSALSDFFCGAFEALARC